MYFESPDHAWTVLLYSGSGGFGKGLFGDRQSSKLKDGCESMETHRIAVISDTHGLLRPECIRIWETCEAILHAGDVGKPESLRRLREIAEVYVVRGNVDKEWAEDLPEELETELYGFRFYMVHNKRQTREDLSGVDIVIYGHSHKYEERTEGGITYLNPGSCGVRRFRLPVTMAVLTICLEAHSFEIEKVNCLSESVGEESIRAFPRKDMDRLVGRIIKEMKAGKGVAEIVGKVQGERELVEQICRIYATHPGVDVEGILNRLELKDL